MTDSKWRSTRKVEQLASAPEDRETFEKLYPGYFFTECQVAYNQDMGTSLYIKMRRHRKGKEGLD